MNAFRFLLLLSLAPAILPAAILDVTSGTYGAVPNDGNDDYTAIQAALTAAQSGDVVYIPAGIYNIETTLTKSAGCVILGDGENGSVLLRSGSATSLLAFSSLGSGDQVTITDLTLRTNSSASGSGLSIAYGSGASPSAALVAKRMQIRGEWSSGLLLNGAKNSSLTDCMIAGVPYNGTGILANGDISGSTFTNLTLGHWHTGVELAANQSSVTFNRTVIVDAIRGVFSGYSVGAFTFKNGHIDSRQFSWSVNIWLSGSSSAVIRNNFFLVAADPNNPSPTSYSNCYNLVFNGSNGVIEDNHFGGMERAGGVVLANGTSGTTFRGNHIYDVYEQANYPFWIQSGASSNSVLENTFNRGGSSPILDQGTSNSISSITTGTNNVVN